MRGKSNELFCRVVGGDVGDYAGDDKKHNNVIVVLRYVIHVYEVDCDYGAIGRTSDRENRDSWVLGHLRLWSKWAASA